MRRGGAGRPGQAKPMKRTGLDHAASASSRSSYVATAGFVDRYTLSPGPTPGPAAPARSTAYAPGARGSAHSHAGGTRGSLARARRLQRLGTDTMPRDRRGVPGGAAPCCPGPAKAKSESRRGSSTACPCRTTTATRHSGRRMLKPCADALRAQRVPRARGAARYLLLHVVHARLRLRLPQPVRPVTTKRDHFGHREHRHSYLQGPYEGQAHRHTCFHRSARAGINRFHRTARAGVHGGRTRTPTEARRARTAASSAAPCSKANTQSAEEQVRGTAQTQAIFFFSRFAL